MTTFNQMLKDYGSAEAILLDYPNLIANGDGFPLSSEEDLLQLFNVMTVEYVEAKRNPKAEPIGYYQLLLMAKSMYFNKKNSAGSAYTPELDPVTID